MKNTRSHELYSHLSDFIVLKLHGSNALLKILSGEAIAF